MSDIKWGRVVLWIVLGALIALLISNLFVVVAMVVRGFQLRGAPPQEEQIAFILGLPNNIVGLLTTILGGFLGGRAVARKAEGSYTLNGLFVGIGVGILVAVFYVTQRGGFSFWVPLHVVLGIAGGWLGGLAGGKKAEAEDLYD
jgi:hypothetical protein